MKKITIRSALAETTWTDAFRRVCNRIALVAAAICAATGNALADCYTYNTAGGTANLGSGTQIDSTDRLLVRKGTVNINEGASIKCGGNTAGSCNFIGVDENYPAAVNINGGTLWCATSKGPAILASVTTTGTRFPRSRLTAAFSRSMPFCAVP